MNHASNTSSWKPLRWLRLDLILSRRHIYINSNPKPLTKFTTSSRSTEFKDIIQWNISQMIMKTTPISANVAISIAMQWGIPLSLWWKVNGNWGINMIRISWCRESHCRINTRVRRKKEMQKRSTVRITIWDLSRNVTHLNKVIWDRKIIT